MEPFASTRSPTANAVSRRRHPSLFALLIASVIIVAMCAAGSADRLERHVFGSTDWGPWSGTLILVWSLMTVHPRLSRAARASARTYAGLFWTFFSGIFFGSMLAIPARSWIDGTGLTGGSIWRGAFMGVSLGFMIGMFCTRLADDEYGRFGRKNAA